MYAIAKKLLFCLPPEVSHDVSLDLIGASERLGLLKFFSPTIDCAPVEVMGLRFSNAVGLAAGLDKNGDYFNALGQLGFGFVEVGTVTPLPQPGNPQPRLFRLQDERAIINRMGFNNKGVQYLLENVKQRRYRGVLGINIGKNKATSEEDALSDYEQCMDVVYPHADYISVNVSSPNTPGLRNLQFGEQFSDLLAGIKVKQKALSEIHGKYVPVAVKIAPDMSEAEIHSVAQSLLDHNIDAVIATNTTVSRELIPNSCHRDEAGGLSGAPLIKSSTQVISVLSEALKGQIPIIGVGGVMSAADAEAKIEAGASLVQIYSGFIYKGPSLVKDAAEAISALG